MDDRGRPNHIEDYLARLHSGSWYGWSNSKNKVYSNLIIHPRIWNEEYKGNISADGMMDNPHSKPTEKECTDGLKAMQDEWDLEKDSYKSKRRAEYKSLADQFDQLYHDMAAGKGDSTGEWFKAVKKVKDDNPKS